MSGINGESTERRSVNKAMIEKSDWIRNNDKIKHLFFMLSNVLPKLPEITLTGSSAILVYLIGKYLEGVISQEKMESLIGKLDRVNDIDAIFPAPVYKSKLESIGFRSQAKVGDVFLEANGIPFHAEFEGVVDPVTYEITTVTIQMEVIIEKTLGKQKPIKKTTKTLTIAGNPIAVKVVSPSALLRQYMEQESEFAGDVGKKDNRRKMEVLRELMVYETPSKEQGSPSGAAAAEPAGERRQFMRKSRMPRIDLSGLLDDEPSAAAAQEEEPASNRPVKKVLKF